MIKWINTSIIYSQNGNKNAVHTLAQKNGNNVGQRGYKWGYIKRSLKSLWLHFARPFNT